MKARTTCRPVATSALSRESRRHGRGLPSGGLYDGGTPVYVTARPAGEDANELGLIVHGPDSSKLIGQVNDLLRR
ncbi:hypothetical protein GCM10022403_084920 [Streptomyces coacervatus]|uniref:Uncharacterized protein n=1 Tax=Streptomyces coacervatus TaxID=647381 RepID=A0ABP7JAK1_9ACTN